MSTSWVTPDDLAKATGMSVKTLRRQLADAPPGLPGAPLLKGAGRTNHYLRWRSMADAERWLEAFTAWRMSGSSATPAPPPAVAQAPEPRSLRPVRPLAARVATSENEAVDWGSVRREVAGSRGTKQAQKAVPERAELGPSRAKRNPAKPASNR